jgi:hypothetical protein
MHGLNTIKMASIFTQQIHNNHAKMRHRNEKAAFIGSIVKVERNV